MLGSAIKDLVVVKMEEYTPYGPSNGAHLIAGGDRLGEMKPVYGYIDQTLAEAATEMLMAAPVNKLTYKTEAVTATPDEDDACIGSIELPSDFLRLHTLRMEGWETPVHYAFQEGDSTDRLQYKRWTRGTEQKPVAVLHGSFNTTSPQLSIRYYSVAPAEVHVIKEFKYVPRFNEALEYERGVAELIALNCAKKIYEIYGNTEQANIMTSEISSVLESLLV